MNLLRIQDALKNASDEQLAGMLRSPDSNAPSYLVLSELKRRKDMRGKMEAEPQATVAEDLTRDTTYDDQGIRALKSPGYEEEAQRAEAEGAEAMREGGVVRMRDGGGTPRPLQDLSEADIARYLDLARQRERLGLSPTGPGAPPYTIEDLVGQQMGLEEIRNLNPAEINRGAFAGSQNLPGSFGAGSVIPVPPETSSQRPPTVDQTEGGQQQQGGQQQPLPATTNQGNNAPAPSPAAPPPATTRPPIGGAGGIGTLAPGGSTSYDEMYERNLARFPGLSPDIQERLRSMRTKPEEERSKALNMSLVEAGLRMMASKNPTLLGSIGESAVPAVQSYAQQQAQIRKDQREDIKDEMALAQSNLARAYYAGQITASQYRTAVSELNANARTAMMANAQLAAAERNAASLESRERIATERNQATLDAASLNAYRSAVTQDSQLREIGTQIAQSRAMLSQIPEGPNRERLQQRITDLEAAARNRRNEIGRELGYRGAGGGNSQVDFNYVPGTGVVPTR